MHQNISEYQRLGGRLPAELEAIVKEYARPRRMRPAHAKAIQGFIDWSKNAHLDLLTEVYLEIHHHPHYTSVTLLDWLEHFSNSTFRNDWWDDMNCVARVVSYNTLKTLDERQQQRDPELKAANNRLFGVLGW